MSDEELDARVKATVEMVNPPARVPHLTVVVGFSAVAVLGYFLFSIWAVFYSGDAALRGDVLGTWKSFAVLALGFWIGSSSGGKIGGKQ